MAEKTSKGYVKPGTGEGSGGLTDADGNPVMTETQKEMEKEREARNKMLEMARKKRMQDTTENKAYGGKVNKMADGGMPMVKKDGKMVPTFAADGVGKMSYGGKVKKMADGKMVTKKKKTAKVAKRRGDGCAVKGKTRGRMV